MKRRQALALLGGAFATRRVWAQSAKRAVIGFLGAEAATGYSANVQALLTGLKELGYIDGANASIEFRWAQGQYSRLPELARDLARMKVDVIVTHGAPGTGAAKRATSTIPIVMASAGDALVTGLVKNLARPEGNVTGSTFFAPEVGAKRLDLLKEAILGLADVTWLFVPGNPITEQIRASLDKAALLVGVRLTAVPVPGVAQLASVVASLSRQRVGAVLVPEYSLFRAQAESIAKLAAANRLPTIGFSEFAEAGGLMGYGPDDAALYRRAAFFVDRILRGAKPGELPVERAATFKLIVNRQTAVQVGVALAPAFLVRADRVIE